MRCLTLPVLLLPLLVPGAALAGTPVGTRLAVHPGYTRLVFDFPQPATADVQRDGTRVVVTFSGTPSLAPPKGIDLTSLHDLKGVDFSNGRVSLLLADGVVLRSFGLGNRRILDLLEPPGPAVSPALQPDTTPPRVSHAHRASSRRDAARSPAAIRAAVLPAPAATPPALALVTAALIAVPPANQQVARTIDPAPERSPRASLDIATDAPQGTLVLAFAPTTGAAAFRRGGCEIVVFDEPRAIDQMELRSHPGYERAEVQSLPGAVVLRVHLPPGRMLVLSHDGTDWSLAPAAATPASAPITVAADGGRMHLAIGGDAPSPGRVITIPDPVTGDTILVGTLRSAGYGLTVARHAPDFTALATDLGVAIEPLSDRVALRGEPAGYVVESDRADRPLAVSPAAGDDSLALAIAGLSRSFSLPNEPPAALLRRLHSQVADASVVPLLGRLPYRRAVAETMLALGMGAESQAVLQLAAIDDPRALADPTIQDLSAAAALIAGRLDETAALTGAPADGSPETNERQFWRALRDAARLADDTPPDPATVAMLDAGLPLLVGYPASLRRTLLPLVADTLLRGNALPSVDRLLAQFPDAPDLALARALAAEKHGQPDQALAAYDQLSRSRDRSVRARAAILALELRLSRHLITAAQAADAADRLIYAWRGDGRELNLRLRIADLRYQAGEDRQELQALRDAGEAFPDQADRIKPRLAAAFSRIVSTASGLDHLSPLETVSLIEENTDLLPDGAAGEAMSGTLADRLAALDLPHQAGDVLAKLIERTPSAAAKAGFGSRLAALQLTEQQPQAALDALAQSDAPGLTPDLAEQRALLAARAHAGLGDHQAALATLSALSDTQALLARASVQEDAHDWPAAAATLDAVLAQTTPASGPLSASQSGVVLRLASASAQAGDEAGLARLRQAYATRLPDSNDAALLALLTEPPIRDTTDLPRAAAETTAARSVSTALQSMP